MLASSLHAAAATVFTAGAHPSADVEAWMRYSELPRPLREKIRGYYAEVWTRHEEVCKGAVTMTSMQ